MIYLKSYKLFESNILDDVKDVLSELTDAGFNIQIKDEKYELMPHWNIKINGHGDNSITVGDFIDICLRIKQMLEQTGDVCRISIFGSSIVDIYTDKNGLNKMSMYDRINKPEIRSMSLNSTLEDSDIEILLIKPDSINELNKSTYLSAANKLANLYHKDRANKLAQHSKLNITIKTEGTTFNTILDTIDISLPCEYVKIWASFDYKTVAKFKDGKFSTIKEVDEYELVEEWLSNRGDELFTIKYTFTFLVLDIDNPDRTNEKLELTFDLCLDNNGFSFLNTENNDFSFYDRSSAKEFKRYFRMVLMESESYIQRIIDNDYFKKLKWESIVAVFDGISLNKLYNKKGITFIDFGLDL